jgi:hypothetical protein
MRVLGRAAYELVMVGARVEIQPGVITTPRRWDELRDDEQREWELKAEVLRRAFIGTTAENMLELIQTRSFPS